MLNKFVALTAGLAAAAAVAPASAQDAQAGAAVFKRCAICHSSTGAISVGPPLNGVVGRKAGAVPKYTYSKAMAGSGMVWDKASLDKFLTRPQGAIPGTKMGFAGIPNAKERQDLIAYLATLRK